MKLVSFGKTKKYPVEIWKKGNWRHNELYCPDSPIPTIDSFFFRLNE